MTLGAFVLKLKTPMWRMCVVKQVPEQSSSSWMLFGQNRKTKTTFQMEFQSYEETTLINHLTDMAHDETEIRLVLVSESPAVSCIESLWSLQGQEMYRKQQRTSNLLFNSLRQDMRMLCISPQMQSPQMQSPQMQSPQMQSPQMQSPQGHHSMQTRSQSKTK
jgi:hypothetical protein